MLTELRAALITFGLLTLLTGGVYPLLVTGVAHAAFPARAAGSLVTVEGKVRGSSLLGQPFESAGYFWGRLSATTPFPYNAGSSSASNLGPTNPALADAASARIKALLALDPENASPIPADLVTASGSGLDPDISPQAAAYQVARVARARKLTAARVQTLVESLTIAPTLGILGEPRVNVLALNEALDQLAK